MDHDQRFKTLIREFFADFLRLFFAVWAARFDLDNVEWLDKEVLPNPPEGSRHLLDLIGRLRTRQPVAGGTEEMLALIDVEIESPERTTEIKPRLPSYYVHLREAHGLPVLSIVIYLKVGLDGAGADVYEERFWELDVLRFRYLYVGLPGLDGLRYLQGDNWLGVALSALMRLPRERIVELGREAYRRLAQAPLTEQQKYLLTECVEAYLPLEEPQRHELQQLLASDALPEVRAMNLTTYDRGRLETMQSMLLRQGGRKLGPPSKEIETRLRENKDVAELEGLVERILEATSWDELFQTVKT